MSTILVVDDEAAVLSAFEGLLTEEGHQVLTARNGQQALDVLQASSPDLVIMDVCMPGLNGLDALERIKSSLPHLPVIVMTAQGTMQTAIEATKRGAFDYQLKPFEPAVMLGLVSKALRATELMQREVSIAPVAELSAGDALIGSSFAMQEVYKAIGRLARSDQPVLIRGESGTGKKLVARAIHRHGRRSRQPLYVVRCSGLSATNPIAELLDGGSGGGLPVRELSLDDLSRTPGATLLLEEIGDATPEVQTRLRACLPGDFGLPPAGEAALRVIATTSRDLERALAAGAIRDDFYHLLGAATIWLPPLRARIEDIRQLAEFLLMRIGQDFDIGRPQLSTEALDVLCRQPWPGNVRELEACLRRSLVFTGSAVLQAEDIRHALDNSGPQAHRTSADSGRIEELVHSYLTRYGGTDPHDQLFRDIERQLLIEALRRTRGNRSRAALLLGISRPTLHAKLEKYAIDAAQFD